MSLLKIIGIRKTANRLQLAGRSGPNSRSVEIHIVPPKSGDDRALDVMIAEAADLTKAMREFLMTADRFVYFAGIISVGTFILTVLHPGNGENWLILILAPYPLAITFGYLIQIYTEVERRAGHKQFLEEEINDRLHSQTLLESQINSSKVRSRPSGILMKILQGGILVVFIGLSAKEAWRFADKGPTLWKLHLLNWNSLNIFLLLFVVALLLQSLRENSVASSDAYRVAKQIVRTSRAKNQDTRPRRDR